MVDLLVQNGELILSTQPRQFEEKILALFDKALSSVENIPQVERAIMKYLFWSHSPTLASVHKRDPKVLSTIQIARNALRIFYNFFEFRLLCKFLLLYKDKALAELDEYMHTYDRFNEFLRLDTAEYPKNKSNLILGRIYLISIGTYCPCKMVISHLKN